MIQNSAAAFPKIGVRQRLLDAALSLIRENGYSSTSVDALCVRAGVTKGGFFHHFASKEALAVAAAKRWSEVTAAVFEKAPYQLLDDPLQRLFAYLEFRKALLRGDLPEYTCFVGTLVQETYGTNQDIRAACEASISGHAATLEADIAAAMQRHGVRPGWTPESLALHTQAVIQGAFILAKAKDSAAVAAESIDHLRRYFELLFNPINGKPKEMS